jgi:hypothetical protein
MFRKSIACWLLKVDLVIVGAFIAAYLLGLYLAGKFQ